MTQKQNSLTVGERFNPYNLFNGIYTPLWLFYIKEISWPAKALYSRLTLYSGKNGACFPSQETLAKEMQTSRSRINVYLNELIKHKLLERTPPTGKDRLLHKNSTYYFLVPDAIFECTVDGDTGCPVDGTPENPVSGTSYIKDSCIKDSCVKDVFTKVNTASKEALPSFKKNRDKINDNLALEIVDYWNKQTNLMTHRIKPNSKTINTTRGRINFLINSGYCKKDILWFIDELNMAINNKSCSLHYLNDAKHTLTLPESLSFSDKVKSVLKSKQAKKDLIKMDSLFTHFFAENGIPKCLLLNVNGDKDGELEQLTKNLWEDYKKIYYTGFQQYDQDEKVFFKSTIKKLLQFRKENKDNLYLPGRMGEDVRIRVKSKKRADTRRLIRVMFEYIKMDNDKQYQLHWLCSDQFLSGYYQFLLTENYICKGDLLSGYNVLKPYNDEYDIELKHEDFMDYEDVVSDEPPPIKKLVRKENSDFMDKIFYASV